MPRRQAAAERRAGADAARAAGAARRAGRSTVRSSIGRSSSVATTRHDAAGDAERPGRDVGVGRAARARRPAGRSPGRTGSATAGPGPASLTSATSASGAAQNGPGRDEAIQPLRSVSFQAPIGRSRSGASATAAGRRPPSASNGATNSPGSSSSSGSATSTPTQASQRPSGEKAGRARVPGEADGLAAARRRRRAGHDPDRGQRPEVGVGPRVGDEGDRAAVGRPGDPASRRSPGGSAGAASRPRGRGPTQTCVPAVAVAHLVPAPVGAGDPAGGHDPALRLRADDEARLGRRRPTNAIRRAVGRPGASPRRRARAPRASTARRRRAPGPSPRSAGRGRPGRSGGRPPGGRRATTRGRVSRTAPVVSCRAGAAAPGRAKRHEVEVRAIRLAVDEPPDDDGAAPVGQRVVLLEDDLAADQVGGSDRSSHGRRVDRGRRRVRPTAARPAGAARPRRRCGRRYAAAMLDDARLDRPPRPPRRRARGRRRARRRPPGRRPRVDAHQPRPAVSAERRGRRARRRPPSARAAPSRRRSPSTTAGSSSASTRRRSRRWPRRRRRPQGGAADAGGGADGGRLGRHDRLGDDARRPRRRDPRLRHGRDRRRPPRRLRAVRRPRQPAPPAEPGRLGRPRGAGPDARSSSSAPGPKAILDVPAHARGARDAGRPGRGDRHRRAARLLLAPLGDPGARSPSPTRRPRRPWPRPTSRCSGSGVLVCVPSRRRTSCPRAEAVAAIARATAEAEAAGIHGPALTPWVLRRVADLTDGRSVRANTALIINDARVAGRLAAALARGLTRPGLAPRHRRPARSAVAIDPAHAAPSRRRSSLAVLLAGRRRLAGCAGDGPFAVTASGTADARGAGRRPTRPASASASRCSTGRSRSGPAPPAGSRPTVTTTGVGGSQGRGRGRPGEDPGDARREPDGSVLLRAVYQPNPASPNNRAASAVVDVPPDAALDLRTSNGTVSTPGIAGPIDGRHEQRRGPPRRGGGRGDRCGRRTRRSRSTGAAPSTSRPRTRAVVLRGDGRDGPRRTSNGDDQLRRAPSRTRRSRSRRRTSRSTSGCPAGSSFALDARTSGGAEVVVDGLRRPHDRCRPASDTLQGTVGDGRPVDHPPDEQREHRGARASQRRRLAASAPHGRRRRGPVGAAMPTPSSPARHRGARPAPRLQGQAGPGRRPRRGRPRGPRRRALRPARPERRRQDDADQDPDDAPPADVRHGPGGRLRRRDRDRPDPAGHEHGLGRRAVRATASCTVREQLWMFSQFYGLGTREGWRRTDELIDLVGLAEQRLQRVSALSTGQRQKLNLARGLVNDPWILFLDEPTLGPRRERGARRPRPLPQLAGGGAGADRAPHDPLHGRGRRAVRPRRDRRPRAGSWPSARRPSSSGASRRSRSSGSRSTGCRAAPAALARLPGVLSAVPSAADAGRRLPGRRHGQPRPGRRRRAGRRRGAPSPQPARTCAASPSPSRPSRTSSSSSSGAASTRRTTPRPRPAGGAAGTEPARRTPTTRRPGPTEAAAWSRRPRAGDQPAGDHWAAPTRASAAASARSRGSSSRSRLPFLSTCAFVLVYRALEAPEDVHRLRGPRRRDDRLLAQRRCGRWAPSSTGIAARATSRSTSRRPISLMSILVGMARRRPLHERRPGRS